MKAIETVKLARDKKRPTASKFIQHIFTDFTELHGDRYFRDDRAIIGGIANIANMPVTVIGIEKGVDTKKRITHNFGSAHPEGYRKALRLMKQAEKFNRPVICLIDTSGAYCGIGAEERGQGRAIAENLMEMMTLKVPIISILLGEGGSGGALALGVANEVWMLEHSVYSVISPEGCAAILYKSAQQAPEAAENLKLTSKDLHKLGVIERIIPEKKQADLYPYLRREIKSKLNELCEMSKEELLEQRYNKFRDIGRS